MKHLKIYEDYFGDEESFNKKDVEFFEDLLSHIDETWHYKDNVWADGKREEVYSTNITIEISNFSPANGNSIKKKNLEFKIIKMSINPKNILSNVSPIKYRVEYGSDILQVPQEKIKEIYDSLDRKEDSRDLDLRRNREAIREEEREEDLRRILNKKIQKYNL